MSNIVKTLNEKECKDIGRRKHLFKLIDGEKVWYKFCPDCGVGQIYKSLSAISFATINNRCCRKCQNAGNSNPFFGKHHTEKHKLSLAQKQTECSYRFKKLGHNPPKSRIKCRYCKSIFYVVKSRRAKYCTYQCAAKDNFGFWYNHKTLPEKKVEKALKMLHESYKYGFYLDGKIYDFYIHRHNLLLEVDGIYWHSKHLDINEMSPLQWKIRLNDLKKVAIAKKHGYNISRIWEDEITIENLEKCIRIFL